MKKHSSVIFVAALCYLVQAASAKLPKDGTPEYQIYRPEEVLEGKVDKLQSLSQVWALDNGEETPDLRLWQSIGLANKAFDGVICDNKVGENYIDFIRYQSSQSMPRNMRLPRALDEFMRGFGVQIVAHCKLNLLDHAADLNKRLGEADLEPILQLERAGGLILDSSLDMHKTDSIRVAAELLQVLAVASDKEPQPQKLNLSARGRRYLAWFKQSCQRSYSKINKRFLNAITTMINLGFDYPATGRLLESRLAELNTDPNLFRWLNVALLCQALEGANNLDESLATTDLPGGQAPVSVLYFEDDEMLAAEMPDGLLVDWRLDAPEVKRLRQVSSLEADELSDKIYKRLVGDSTWRKYVKSSREFRRAYLHFVNARISATPDAILSLPAASSP